MLEGIKRAVFFGAHTDDEMICAGALHRLVQQGCRVWVITFGPAATRDDRLGSHLSLATVRPEWEEAMDAIGVNTTDRGIMALTPSSELTTFSQKIGQTIYDICEDVKPDAVFTLSPEDENPAHAVVGIQTERVTRGRVPITIRCQFPWNYGIGRPNLYVKLSDTNCEAKQKVIRAYKSQHWRYNYEEMLFSFCRADGLSIKVPAAEKFELIRGVV